LLSKFTYRYVVFT